jgi:hypothetical protein
MRKEIPKETTTENHGKCYQDGQEDHWTGDREANCQISCWVTNNEGSDVVGDSTPSETEKETADKAGTGNVQAPTRHR